jgi:TonB family protein
MTWWQYLILVNIYLVLFYGFYVMLLSRETFFQLNRVYMVMAVLLSFFIPLIQSNWVKSLFITKKVNYTIYTSPVMFYHFKAIKDTQITIGEILVIIYLTGIVYFIGRFIWQLVVLNKIINQPQASVAYSFFKKIKIGENIADNKVIAAHENVHAGQWHSADVLLVETVMVINWFNPVVYLYRLAIKHIHEFIADRQAIKSGTNKEDYALLLLSQTFNAPAHQLVNPFYNHSLLRQRIIMMQKNNSNRMALIKYGLSVPLFVLMLILSSATVNNSKPVRLFNRKAGQLFLLPAVIDANNLKTDNRKVEKPVILNLTGKITNIKLVTPTAAADTTRKDDGPIFSAVEQVPEFAGGLPAFGDFLVKNIKYPAEARKNGIQGKVFIAFVVEKDGSLSNIRVVRGVDNALDQEALRVLEISPKWTPGFQNGKPVRVMYSVPISFTLDDVKPVKPAENKTGAVNENAKPAGNSFASGTGVIIKSDTGGRPLALQLRGALAPIYILDGKEINDLSTVNPKDIESISVLKDKASEAIYGTKGANGVIVITTKKSLLKINPVPPVKN